MTAGIELTGISARGAAERGRARTVLTSVGLAHQSGVLAIIGAHKDGTALLFDVLDGTTMPRAGRVTVFGGAPGDARRRIARVSLEAPLPEALRVDEVCDLAADVRGEPRRSAAERLGTLGLGTLGPRRVRSLSVDERRAVAFAIALSSKADVLLIEEPFAVLDPVAPRLVADALRARATSACVVVTTASPRDASRIADVLGMLTMGVYAPLSLELAHTSFGPDATCSIRVVVTPTQGKAGAASLISAMSGEDAVVKIETSSYASGGVGLLVTGTQLEALSRAVTRAIANARVDVELIEPSALPLDAIRVALAARALSPPPGSLPPGPLSVPPVSLAPVSVPPASVPPASLPPGGAL